MANDENDTAFRKNKTQEPLFRITEIFLWDDERIHTSGISTHNAYLSIEPAACSLFQTENESLCVEEVELAQQMDALGLPLSFGTSKARNKVTSRSKRNGTKANFASLENEINDPIPEIMIFSQMENPASSAFLHDNTNISSYLYAMEDKVDVSYHDAKEHSWGDLKFDESNSMSALGSRNETFKKPSLDEVNNAICGTLAKSEFSSGTLSFELNAEVSESLSLHDDSPPEEVLEDACSRSQFHHDGDLLNEHHLDRCSDNSTTSCWNMNLKWDTKTLQSYVSEKFPLHQLGDHHDNFIYCERGDWKVIWDPFYENYYFFNVQTLESTWFPPLGFEKYAFDSSNLTRKETHEGASEKNAGSKHSCGSISVVTDAISENRDSFHFTGEQTEAEQAVKILDEENKWKDLDEQKGKQQGDRLAYDGHDRLLSINESGNAFSIPETYTTSSIVLDAAHENVAINKIVRKSHSGKVQTRCPSDSLLKYWHQRYSLFSRFDNGIKMDEESWFSVTPEQIAMHHAFRCGAGTIIDCFTGVGGNAIQFAMRSNHVIAIDVDPQKIDYAQQNAFIYGVSERIDFIKGDFFKIAPSFKGDIAFLAPPWGGPDYAKMRTYDISSLKPREGQYLFKIASMIADKVVMFLPRNVDLEQLADLSFSADPPWNLEVEKNYLNGKVKSITAYFDRTMS